MLYLRTGGNGSGKTLLTLKDVRELQLQTKRPVCYNLRPADHPTKPNTPYCNLKPEVIEEFGWKGIHFKDWEAQESGTIFVIDECHYDMPKGGTAKPPQHIERLTEHRSRGFDFFLLTQHPSNIDVFVRKLVQAPGWHQHIKRLAGALAVANVVQWDAVNLQCEQAGSGKSGEVKTRLGISDQRDR
jgi:zona occludens toxin